MFKKFTVSLVFLIAALGAVSAKADVIGTISNVNETVDSFNGLNNGRGLLFHETYSYSNGTTTLHAWQNGEMPNLSAYSDLALYDDVKHNYGEGFRTFCAARNVQITSNPEESIGRISYDGDNPTQSNSYGKHLSIATAALYAMFATGTLNDFAYDNAGWVAGTLSDYDWLGEAIHSTMLDGEAYGWTDNKYLTMLLEIKDDKEYWLSDYDAALLYEEIGNYSVFLVQTQQFRENGGWTTTQDLLYIASGESPATTPEPGTMLIFGIAASMLPLCRRNRKRETK